MHIYAIASLVYKKDLQALQLYQEISRKNTPVFFYYRMN
jgi:hypothetical protein